MIKKPPTTHLTKADIFFETLFLSLLLEVLFVIMAPLSFRIYLLEKHLYECNFAILFYTTLCYLSIFFDTLSYNIFEVMKLKPLKEKISITIDNDLLEKLKLRAELDDRSLSQYINIVLKQHVKDIEEKKS